MVDISMKQLLEAGVHFGQLFHRNIDHKFLLRFDPPLSSFPCRIREDTAEGIGKGVK